MARISYVELPASPVGAVRDFYADAFGWTFTDFGADYSATMGRDVDLGLNGHGEETVPGARALIQVEDLEAALESVVAAGGNVTVPIFAFPGGRRFHFRDPGGNELGVFINEPEQH